MDFMDRFSNRIKGISVIGTFGVVVYGILMTFIKDMIMAIHGTLIIMIAITLWLHNDDIDNIKKQINKPKGDKNV